MIFTASESKIPSEYMSQFEAAHNLLFAGWGEEKIYLDTPIYVDGSNSIMRKQAYSFRLWEYPAALYYSQIKESDIILDVGGGFSAFAPYLATFVHQVFCIDNGKTIPPLFKIWQESLVFFDTVRQGKIEVIIQDAASLPFPDKFFDKIFSFSALEHFEDGDILAAKEIARCLKDDGIFCGTVDWSPVSEYPLAAQPEYRAYTYDSFYQRIMKPGNFVFMGEPSAAQMPLPQAMKCITALCFYLLKRR